VKEIMAERYGSPGGISNAREIIPITDKDAQIPYDLWYPTYTDKRFTERRNDGLTVFLDSEAILLPGDITDETCQELGYSYSDTVQQIYGQRAVDEVVRRARSEVDHLQSARFLEQMLKHLFKEESLWLGHLRVGINPSTRNPFRVYGTRPNWAKQFAY